MLRGSVCSALKRAVLGSVQCGVLLRRAVLLAVWCATGQCGVLLGRVILSSHSWLCQAKQFTQRESGASV